MWHDSQTEIIASSEARTHFYALLRRAESGSEIIITRYGSPIAKLVPTKKLATPEERAEAIRRWREISKGITLGGLKISDLIKHGRR